MVQEKLQEITGFRIVGDENSERGVGILFGYPVEAEFSKKERHKGSEIVLVFTTDQGGLKIKELRKILREKPELKGKVDALAAEAGELGNVLGNKFQIKIKAIDSTELENLYNLTVKILEEGLRGLMTFTPPVTCKICRGLESDTLANIENALTYVHKSCLEQQKKEAEEAFEEKSMNPKTIEGVVGGVIGGALGAVPALIALVAFSYFVGILYALIPLGIYYGWKLLKGKLTKMTTVFTIIYTIVMSFLVWALSIAIIIRNEMMYEFGFEIPLGDALVAVFEIFTDYPDLFIDYMLTDALFAFGSAVIGIWIVWRQITKTDEETFSQMQTTYDGAIPLELVTTENSQGLENAKIETSEEFGTLSTKENQQFDSQTSEDNDQTYDHTV
jgi:hypothetical protein